MEPSLRILVVTNSTETADRILLALQQGGLYPSLERVHTTEGLRAALIAQTWDAVLSDHSPPGFGAEANLGIVRMADAHLPFLVVSDSTDEEDIVALMRNGANDYIHKQNFGRLARAVNRAVTEARHHRARSVAQLQAQQLAAIVSDADVAVISTTLDGIISTWNVGAERLYGYAAREVIGQPIAFLLPPSGAEELHGVRERIGRGEPVPVLDVVRLHKNGTPLDIAMSLSPIRNTEGGIVGVSGMGMDISARKRTEQELRRTAELFQTVADGASGSVFVKDLAGRYLFVNTQEAQIVGRPSADILGKDDASLFKTVEARRKVDRDRRVIESGQKETYEEEVTSGGVTRTFLTTRAPYRDSTGKVIGIIGISYDITDRKRVENELRLHERAIQAAAHGIVITDPNQHDNPIIYASAGFERITGCHAEDVIGRNCRFLQGKDTDPVAVALVRESIQAGQTCTVEVLNYRQNGSPFWNELSISPVRDATGRITHFVGIQADVTNRRHLEEEFHQVQKMETVSQLAAGVAHDFHSLLTIINGCAELIQRTMPVDDPARELVVDISKAGERSARLTRQLLAFSRQQNLDMRVLDLNTILVDREIMIRRLCGQDIQLNLTLDPVLWTVRADVSQIEHVLTNLVANAVEAMPEGGLLTISTSNIDLDEAYVRSHRDTRTGPHVLLSVMDSGCGMTPEVRGRLFEPFFTTRDWGRNMGLGLATVYGIIKQSGGHITVYSQVGIGTTFNIYLPGTEHTDIISRPAIQTPPRGKETLLLAEDDDGVRALSRNFLISCGYTVLEAANGDAALRTAKAYEGPIHMLIVDVIMPGLGGRAVAEQLQEQYPDISVLFISGYTDGATVRQGVRREGVPFLAKPFTLIALATKVREVLDMAIEKRE